MAIIPTQKRITTEEFPEQKDWIGKLLSPLNKFMEDVTRNLRNELTFSQNFNGMVQTVVLDGVYPKKFRWTRNSRPVAAWIGQCRETSADHTAITTALYLDWEYNQDGQIQINNVAGLSPSATNLFNLTVIVVAG